MLGAVTSSSMDADFIDGQFSSARSPEGELCVRSPADQNDVVLQASWSTSQVDKAVDAARTAFSTWRKTSPTDRAQALHRYQAALRAHQHELAHAISREIGKPRWEAHTEVQAMISKVDITLNEGLAFTKDVHIENLPGEIRYRPHGVVAILGPFNFPGHLPNGQLVPALASGNTVVLKPSDKGPLTARWMAQCIQEANFPPGVFNVVQGGVSVAEHLSTHPGIDALLFTGSLGVGQRIVAANAHRPGLLIALELGGKNASLVLDDADIPRAVREITFSGFATAGQRCTATSRVFVCGKVADALCTQLAAAARSLSVGHPEDANVFMGPLISEAARARLLAAQTAARTAGYEALVPGGIIEARTPGFYVRPAIHRAPTKRVAVPEYSDTELFGPDLSITIVNDTDEAIALANESAFGLSAAVFTGSREQFEHCANELRVGVVHWNRSSAGASGRLPFGGIKHSGNHRPAGILMGTSCVFPQGILLAPQIDAPLPTWPGIAFSE